MLAQLTGLWRSRSMAILLLMILFYLLICSINPAFFGGATLTLLLKSSAILVIMCIGQAFVLLTGHIDVSVGSTMGISAAVGGILLADSYSITTVILAVLLLSICIGAVNGIGISFLNIPSIIMTLGTMGIIRGFMLITTGGKWVENIPNYYKQLSQASFLSVPFPVWIAFVLLCAAFLFFTFCRWGQYVYAVGDNRKGAVLVGIPVKKVTLLAFIASSFMAGIAGLLFIMNIGFVPNQTGSGLELQVIAAAVLGGISLNGGSGSILGAGIGALFFTMINTSLIYMKIPAYYNNAISGLLLLIIIIFDSKFHAFFNSKDSRVSYFKRKRGKQNGLS
ncbi:ABC transporter permease [Bacillus sp. 1P06AnD]|uniref:ABC transporter permease n=1 Tax=Bacillus sp. 1P06AnD TaxID=3132208 RepID=UPI0039A01142